MRIGHFINWLRKWLTHSAGGLATERKRLAIFIDADNVSVTGLSEVVRDLEARFDTYVKRAYSANFNGRIEFLGRCAVKPVQTYPSIHGRGATDVALAIDAVQEIQRADAFCIVSCDADFAGLLQRLREVGKYIIVAGPSTRTSAALRVISHEFLTFEESQSKPAVFDPRNGHRAAISKPNPQRAEDVCQNLVQDLTRTFRLLQSASIRPTMREVEAKHRDLNPNFCVQNYKFPKGNPPTLQRASNFVELLRTMGAFRMTRVPGTRGSATDYFLTLR